MENLTPEQLAAVPTQDLSAEETRSWCHYHLWGAWQEGHKALNPSLLSEVFDLGKSVCRSTVDIRHEQGWGSYEFENGCFLIQVGALHDQINEVIDFYHELFDQMVEHQRDRILWWFLAVACEAKGDIQSQAQEFYISELVSLSFSDEDMIHYPAYYRMHELLADSIPFFALTSSQRERLEAKMESLRDSEYGKTYERLRTKKPVKQASISQLPQ